MSKTLKYEPTQFMAKGSYYDKQKADRAVKFIECLSHSKGEWHGRKFKLLPWQEKIIRDVFGTIKEDGCRQFNTAYIEIPKKQGKSELAAAVALYLLCADNEPGAEIYSAAADRQQAGIVFEVACAMVDLCPPLKSVLKVIPSNKRIVYPKHKSFYQVLSAEVASKHGYNVHGVVFDELHAQPNRKLYDVLTKGAGDARRQNLNFVITTSGTDRHSICWEIHQKASDILRDKKKDETFYPCIYGAAEEDDWSCEKVWAKANPSLGVTVDISKLRAAYQSARDNPAEENLFRQLRLNQWVKQAVRWMPMHAWDACAGNGAVDEDSLVGRPCYGGLDLSSTTDITAFVLVFPPFEDDEYFTVLPFFWLPEETIALRSRRDHVPYDIWKQKGLIKSTEGNVVDYRFIERFILDLRDKYEIREIAVDRWNATNTIQNLSDEGLTLVPFGQGFRDMSPATKELMKLTLEKKLYHGGHEALRWMVDNIFIRTDPAGNIKPDKEKSTEKIDGAVATIMALSRAMLGGGQSGSVYDHRGLLTF